ncbi:hypothetical protein BD414DRAFT_510689 [Trametes punicea]|nr:hypothetical protein BD414DRAFT_510689 [Trametes punicea]
MYFFAILSLLASLAVGQKASILSPAPESRFLPGDSFVVDVDRAASTSTVQEVSVAIGLLSCAEMSPTGSCDVIDTSQGIGTVLYSGPYSPVQRTGGTDLSQNFTVTVPSDFPAGAAALSVAHFSLIGAWAWPTLEVLNETIIIA